MAKTLPSHAEDVGLIPGWGTKIPHAARQLSPCVARAEPVLSCPCATTREACELQRGSSGTGILKNKK